jgi:hypothetical protein
MPPRIPRAFAIRGAPTDAPSTPFILQMPLRPCPSARRRRPDSPTEAIAPLTLSVRNGKPSAATCCPSSVAASVGALSLQPASHARGREPHRVHRGTARALDHYLLGSHDSNQWADPFAMEAARDSDHDVPRASLLSDPCKDTRGLCGRSCKEIGWRSRRPDVFRFDPPPMCRIDAIDAFRRLELVVFGQFRRVLVGARGRS